MAFMSLDNAGCPSIRTIQLNQLSWQCVSVDVFVSLFQVCSFGMTFSAAAAVHDGTS